MRGVTLYGIDSVMVPKALRELAWSRLAQDLDKRLLDLMTREVPLCAAIKTSSELLLGRWVDGSS